MTTTAQNAVHRIGKWTGSQVTIPRRANKPQESQECANAGAQQRDGAGPKTLELKPQGHTMVCMS